MLKSIMYGSREVGIMQKVHLSIWIVLSISVYLILYKLQLNKASSLNEILDSNGITLTLPTLHVEVESFDCSSFEFDRVKNKRDTAKRETEKISRISVSLVLLKVYLESDQKRLKEER